MKKSILILTLLITSSFVFADEDVNIKNDPYFKDLEIPNGVTVINTWKERNSMKEKTILYVTREKTEDFLKRVRNDGNPEVFPNKATVTMKDIIGAVKEGKEIWEITYYIPFTKDIWYESNTNGISTEFSQSGLWGRVSGFGIYEISVYLDDYVYTFDLLSPYNDQKRSGPMDALSEYMYFDYEKEKNGDQDYYWKKDGLEVKYFNDLTAKKKTLPKEVIEFQTTYEELIRNIIEHFE